MIDATNCHYGDIMTSGRQRQVKFTTEKTWALIILSSREDAKLMEGQLKFGEGQLKFGEDTLAIKDPGDGG
ncbi:hypothetical protein E2C01_029018 [Portunus trituberculatus]|uniref:Uncharacterized protein n=1 Tax=Portunus trituberculatus TaxID=210409 RepID=A0A5B7ERP5_PORTR|nr:hypothetical protein [Portunus trituberculatus]